MKIKTNTECGKYESIPCFITELKPGDVFTFYKVEEEKAAGSSFYRISLNGDIFYEISMLGERRSSSVWNVGIYRNQGLFYLPNFLSSKEMT